MNLNKRVVVNPFDENLKKAGVPNPRGWDFHFQKYVFDGLSLEGKSVLDIGGGSGLASFWAVNRGLALSATVVDPLSDGANSEMRSQYSRMAKVLDLGNKVDFYEAALDEVGVSLGLFDIVLLHNSINHVNEEFTRTLTQSAEASESYRRFADLLLSHLEEGGRLVMSDCSSKNFFSQLGLPSPFAPGIDWRIHQTPAIWAELFSEQGFRLERTTWATRREFGLYGKLLLGNAIGAYLTTSQFTVELSKNLQ